MLSRVIFLIYCILMGDLVTASKPLSILLIETVLSPSHHVWTEHLVTRLLRKSHHIHAVSILETKDKGKLVQNLTCADVRIFLDGAKNGAIVISLGTNVKWKHLNLDTVKTVILALSKLKQQMLWKLDIEVPFEIPENVMVIKWMPQSEVLSHKNVRVVWTHGLLSAQEAIWKGIPMIVMPFFGDQKFNTRILVAKGVGIYLDIKTLSTQSILHAVKEVLYNESYMRNMKQLSSEFRGRPISPLDLAVWSIEYTVRHPNGTLVMPLKSQSWVEQNLIDVYAFLFLNFFIIRLDILYCSPMGLQ